VTDTYKDSPYHVVFALDVPGQQIQRISCSLLELLMLKMEAFDPNIYVYNENRAVANCLQFMMLLRDNQ